MLAGLTEQNITTKIIISFLIFIVSIISAKIIIFIIENYVKKIAIKTKTDVDDKIILAIKTPLYIFDYCWWCNITKSDIYKVL